MILQKLIKSFSKTDDFIKTHKFMHKEYIMLQKLIKNINKTYDFIKMHKNINKNILFYKNS